LPPEPLEIEEEEDEGASAEAAEQPRERERPRRRRRRRGNGDGRPDRYQAAGEDFEPETEADVEGEVEAEAYAEDQAETDEVGGAEGLRGSAADSEAGAEARRRRRGRRGGRRRGRSRDNGDFPYDGRPDMRDFSADEEFAAADVSDADAELQAETGPFAESADATLVEEPFAGAGDSFRSLAAPDMQEPSGNGHAEEIAALREAAERTDSAPVEDVGPAGGAVSGAEEDRIDRTPAEPPMAPEQAALPEPVPVPEPVSAEAAVAPEVIEDDRPKRSGWWSRRSLF
jgi:ribonuclease E